MWRKAAQSLRFLCISLSGLGMILQKSVKIGWVLKALMPCKYHLLQNLGHVETIEMVVISRVDL